MIALRLATYKSRLAYISHRPRLIRTSTCRLPAPQSAVLDVRFVTGEAEKHIAKNRGPLFMILFLTEEKSGSG
jgi:hypothetical protein